MARGSVFDRDELEKLIAENQKRIDEAAALLARMEEKRRASEERQALLARKSFKLPEAFELLGRLDPKTLEYRHVALHMLPDDSVPLDQAIGSLLTWEKLVLSDSFDKKFMLAAEAFFTRVKEKAVFACHDLGDVADAFSSIRDSGLSKLSADMLRGAVKRIAVDLDPSTDSIQRGLRTPGLRTLVTDIMIRRAVKSLTPWGSIGKPVTSAQVHTALEQETRRGGFPVSVVAKVAANDAGLRQWLKDRTVARDDWLCLNPNGHISTSAKIASVFAFSDPDVAFEFKLTFA